MDLIERQAAIRWVKTECNPYGKPTLDYESGKRVMKHLELMPSSQPEQQWIPCSERLPEHTGAYLLTTTVAVDKYVITSWYSTKGGWICDGYPEARNRCPSTCAQYRDGWNDAMNYIFRDGEGYRPYRKDQKYE